MKSCPICRADWVENECTHLLANFDLTFSDAGTLGAGLGGGELYEVQELADLIDAVRRAWSFAIFHGTGNFQRDAGALHEPLRSYALLLLDADTLEYDPGEYPTPEDIECSIDEFIDRYPDEVREFTLALLDRSDIAYSITSWELDEIPGQSSMYENWWCDDPRMAAADVGKLALELQKSLGSLLPPD